MMYTQHNGDWSLQLRPVKKPKDSAEERRNVQHGGRRRGEVTTIPDTRRETLRVVVTGSFAGETELHATLEADDSGFEVVAWTPEVKDAVLYLGTGDVAAVLVGIGPEGVPHTWALARDVAALRRHGRVPVLLLARELNTEIVDAAFAAGVDDVLVLPQTVEQLAFAIHKTRQGGRNGCPQRRRRLQRARGHRVLAEGRYRQDGALDEPRLGACSAIGSSAFSWSTSICSSATQRSCSASIRQRTLYDLVTAPGTLDAGKLEGYVTPHKCGLHILAAPLRPEEAELVTEAKVTELLEVAKEAYDIVIVDTSPFFYGPMLALLEPTDQLFMLCGLDVPTLKNVKLSLQTLEQLGFPMSRTELVLNRVAPKVGLSKEDVEETLGVQVSHEIPNDPIVAPSVNRGAAAVLLEPESEFAAAIAALAAAADPVGATPAAALATTSKRRWLTPARRLLEGRSS